MTITLGNLITIVAVLFGLFMTYAIVLLRLQTIEIEQTAQDKRISILETHYVTQVDMNDRRLSRIEQSFRDYPLHRHTGNNIIVQQPPQP